MYIKNKLKGKIQMKEIEIIISLAGTLLGVLITLLTFIVKTVKNVKAKMAIEQSIQIGNAILPFIREAEKFTNYTGEEKKAYVMTKANRFALNNSMKFDELQVSDKIEELVTLTREVNTKDSQPQSWL